MAPKDPIALVLATIAAGATAGAATITLGVIALRAVSLAQTEGTASFMIISTATLGGAVVAAATAWHLTESINDIWRRGVTSAIATMLGFIVAALSAPADMVGGIPALIVFLCLLVGVSVVSYKGALSSIE